MLPPLGIRPTDLTTTDVGWAFPPPMAPEWSKKKIDDEIRENGEKVDLDLGGYDLLKLFGFEMEVSSKVARGQFIVNEKSSEPNGELIRGVVDYIAESLASAAAVHSSQRGVLGVELNLSHLRPAYIGQEVTAIATPLKQGTSTQVWEVKFQTEAMKESATESNVDRLETVLIAIARFTLVIQTSPGMKRRVVQSKL